MYNSCLRRVDPEGDSLVVVGGDELASWREINAAVRPGLARMKQFDFWSSVQIRLGLFSVRESDNKLVERVRFFHVLHQIAHVFVLLACWFDPCLGRRLELLEIGEQVSAKDVFFVERVFVQVLHRS